MSKRYKTSSYTYRRMWETLNNKKIPKDDDGRTYEIHHLDGNRDNNTIENLLCVSIKEHYHIHYNNGDWGACVMIAKRMNLSPNHLSDIQRGKKRPGIGGAPKGRVSWNKGLKGYKVNLSEEAKERKRIANTNAAKKILKNDVMNILNDFNNKVYIDNPKIGVKQKSGRYYTYTTAFCELYAKKYNVSIPYIRLILQGKARTNAEK